MAVADLKQRLRQDAPGAWRDHAACADYPSEWWFPPGNTPGAATTRAARDICRNHCPVQTECLGYAITNRQPIGIWGGHGIAERDRIGTRRRNAQQGNSR